MTSDIRIAVLDQANYSYMQERLSQAFLEAFTCPPFWNGGDGGHKLQLGGCDQPNTARWMVKRFLENGQRVLIAYGHSPGKAMLDSPILGFAFGGAMNSTLHEQFQLEDYGADEGDGILPFAGIVPLAQGYRLDRESLNILRTDDGTPLKKKGCSALSEGVSLYRIMFERRLQFEELRGCKRIYLRTRQVLGPVIAMATKHGFKYRGSFFTVWQGVETQDRMVFCLER